ncbi:CoA-binding protein [Longibacter salinarum]|uniref:CoA-binding protein n=1 Tax=Longibacter salinarum TaxID=1850348 RepID=A0A2A8CYC7_9BACT|nr:CoA-binding protein [Longibacter salinarum]PEN13722.1 CoA-binding protein [Longibacter salinarum]
MSDIPSILREADVIAVVGLSGRPQRTSHQIAKNLQQAGYRIIPVNPNYDEVLGEPAVASLQDLPDESVDIINVFRAPEHTAGVVRDAIEYAGRTSRTPVIWTQLGVSSPEAESLAKDANLPYIRNRCIAVELAKI